MGNGEDFSGTARCCKIDILMSRYEFLENSYVVFLAYLLDYIKSITYYLSNMAKKTEYRKGNGCILYCRVSDASQVNKGHSIKEQEPMLRKFAKDNELITKKVFKDKAKSGTSMGNRDGLYSALAYASEHTDISVFIVQDTDRLARDEHGHFTIRAFLRKYGIKLMAMNQPYIGDSPEGRLMDTLLAGVNAFQSRITGRKVSQVLDRLAAKGKTTGPAPLGYINVNLGTEDNPNRTVQIDPTVGPIIKKAFEMYATGDYSITDITNHLTKKGVRSTQGNIIHRSSMANILANPYYKGKIVYKGKIIDGEHTELISDALFQQCKNMLAEHNQYAVRKRKPENHTKFFLRGFLRCGICGHRVTGSHVKGKNVDYYYCSVKKGEKGYHSNAGQIADIDSIESQIMEFFNLIELKSSIMEQVLSRAREILAETHTDVDREKETLQRQNISLEKQRQVLETKLLKGIINDDVYTRNHTRIEEELSENEIRIKQIGNKRQDNTVLFESLVRLANDLPKAYRKSAPEVKMMYLNIFWDYFEIKNKTISKAVPSKIVASMINDGLIKLKDKTHQQRVLISDVWLLGLDSNQ